MAVHPKYLLVLLCALITTGLYAENEEKKEKGKWDGHIMLNGGSNFQKDEVVDKFSNNNYAGEFKLGYSRQKFKISALTGGSYNDNIKSTSGFSYNVNQGREQAISDYSLTTATGGKLNAALDALYTPSDRDKITVKYSFSRVWNKPYNSITSLNYLTDPMTVQCTGEETDGRKNTHIVDAKWKRLFQREGRELEVLSYFENAEDERYTLWGVGKARIVGEELTDPDEESYVRYKPRYADLISRTGASFTEKNFCNARGLDMVFGLNITWRRDLDDYLAEDLVDDKWVEREWLTSAFRYYSLQIDPRVRLKYSIGKIALEAEVIPQYYDYSLGDATHDLNFENASPEVFGFAKFIWKIARHHSIDIGCDRSIKRPEYLQMCWFQRPGIYSNELLEGNPDLKASSRNKMFVSYKYVVGRFSTNLDLEYTYAKGTIEQTFRNEVIDDKDFRVYTWVNAGHSYTTKGTVAAKWIGRMIKADLAFNINWFRGFNKDNALTQSNDYNLKGNIKCDFGGGWNADASLRYQSDIKRNYTSMTEHITCDLRVSKAFQHFEIFLEGLDLLEKPIEKTVLSIDSSEGRLEEIYFNRRLFRLGVKYKF